MESLNSEVNNCELHKWYQVSLAKFEEGGFRPVNGRKCLNFLFRHNLYPDDVIKVCGLWTEMKMPTGTIQKFHVYDTDEKHRVRSLGPVCASSPGAWTLSGYQPQQHTGKNFQHSHNTSIFLFGFTLSSSTVEVLTLILD